MGVAYDPFLPSIASCIKRESKKKDSLGFWMPKAVEFGIEVLHSPLCR